MNATKLILTAALLTGVSTRAFAGPGPQYWAQQARNAQERQAKADAAVQAKTAPAAAKDPKVCADCNCPAMQKT